MPPPWTSRLGGVPARPSRNGSPTCSSRMSLREKVAQLRSLWLGTDASGQVAPHQHDFALVHHRLGGTDQGRSRPAHPPLRHSPGGAGSWCAAPGATTTARDGRRAVWHPGNGARGVPYGPYCLEGDHLPVAAVLGSELRPRSGRRGGRSDRPHAATARSAPGAGPGPRCRARPALGQGRRDNRRRPLPRGHHRERLRPRARIRRHSGDSEALCRLFLVARREELRPRLGRAPGASGRPSPPVRNGVTGRGSLRHELLHRHRRSTCCGRRDPADGPSARFLGVHGDRGFRLLRDRFPGEPAPCRPKLGRSGRVGSRGRRRC